MGTFDEAFGLFKDKTGYDAKKVTFFTWLAWVMFAAMLVSAIHLSANGLQTYIWKLLGLYMVFVALPLLFSPVLWFIYGFALYIIGQFGGKKGFSFDDGVTEVKKWGVPALNKGGYVLLMAIPLWFIAMGILNTKGYEDWAYVFLIITPALIYLCVRRWPTGEMFEAIVRWSYITIAVIIAGVMVLNTIDRLFTEPADQSAEEVHQKKEEQRLKNEKELFDRVHKEVQDKHEHLVNPIALAWYKRKLEETKRPKINRALESVGLTASAVTDAVGGATSATNSSAGASWLGKYWPAVVVAIALTFLVWRIVRRRKATVATTAAAASPAAKPWSLWSLVADIALILTLLWVWWFFTLGHTETLTMQFNNRLPGSVITDFPAGSKITWKVRGNRGVVMTEVRHVDGSTERFDLARQIMIDGAMQHECFTQPKGRDSPINFPIWGTEGLALPLAATKTVTIVFQVCPEGSPIGAALQRWGNEFIPSFQ